jgi:hypothetical protein
MRGQRNIQKCRINIDINFTLIIWAYVGIIININFPYAFKSHKSNLFLPLLEEITVSVWRIETLKF